jgi:hypothetical protein
VWSKYQGTAMKQSLPVRRPIRRVLMLLCALGFLCLGEFLLVTGFEADESEVFRSENDAPGIDANPVDTSRELGYWTWYGYGGWGPKSMKSMKKKSKKKSMKHSHWHGNRGYGSGYIGEG